MELAINSADILSMLPKQEADKATLEMMTGGLLPWVTVQGTSGGKATSDTNTIGKLLLNTAKDKYVNLGTEAYIIPLAYRHKAVDFGKEKVIAYFERESAEFQDIINRADNLKMDAKCIYGTELLLLVSNNGTANYATIYLSSTTLRNTLGDFVTCLGKVTKVATKLLKKKSYSWYTVDLTLVDGVNFPVPSDLRSRVEKFLSVKGQQAEEAEGR